MNEVKQMEEKKASGSFDKAEVLGALLAEMSLNPDRLADLTVRELLGAVLSQVAQRERGVFLQGQSSDKSNGYYARNFSVGSLPIEAWVPRVRSGEFYSSVFPPRYQRAFPKEHQEILFSLLLSSRSKSAAKEALKKLKLPYSADQIEQIHEQVLEDFQLKNTQPLDPDLLALFFDGKAIEVREGTVLKPFTIYLAIGLLTEGKKRILACLCEEGRESLEGWKKLLRNLLDRGLRRIMLIVQDDFSGLSKLTQSLFPQAMVQLCTVHMMRNVTHHMSKEDAKKFNGQLQSIFHAYTQEKASADFDELCKSYQQTYPTFIETLLKKKELYLQFLKLPQKARPMFSSTNTAEGINRIFEKIRINNGGYFQSINDLTFKLELSIQSLEQRTWLKPSGSVHSLLQELNRIFHQTFEENV